jgi:drug/metabolite transporter (DMT)-like permease
LTAVALALGASLFWGLADFGAGIASRRVAVVLVLAISQAAALAFVVAVVLATGQDPPSAAQFAWGALAGSIGVVALASFYRAMQIGAIGIVGPISASQAIVPLTYGLARGERPSTLQGIGVGLAVVGVIAASIDRHPETKAARVGAGVWLALLAAAGFGVSVIALSKAAAGGWAWAPLSMRAAAAPLCIIAVLVLRPSLTRVRAAIPLLVAVGILDTAGVMFFGLASTRGLLSIVAVLATLYPVVLVVLARVVLNEKIARHQLLGVVVALAGVALISAG